MKLSILIGALSAVCVMASPHAVRNPIISSEDQLTPSQSRLNRLFKEVQVAATPTANIPFGTYQIACVECPCDVSLNFPPWRLLLMGLLGFRWRLPVHFWRVLL